MNKQTEAPPYHVILFSDKKKLASIVSDTGEKEERDEEMEHRGFSRKPFYMICDGGCTTLHICENPCDWTT